MTETPKRGSIDAVMLKKKAKLEERYKALLAKAAPIEAEIKKIQAWLDE